MLDLPMAFRLAMAKKGLRTAHLARLVDMDESQMSKIVRGDTDIRISTLVRITGAFNMPLSEFVKLGEG